MHAAAAAKIILFITVMLHSDEMSFSGKLMREPCVAQGALKSITPLESTEALFEPKPRCQAVNMNSIKLPAWQCMGIIRQMEKGGRGSVVSENQNCSRVMCSRLR